jgi:cadmium resistance protein CadD (predicted permease)
LGLAGGGGQYLGFTALVALSLAGAEALRAVPAQWAGLLSLIPVALGIRGLWQLRGPDGEPDPSIRADSTITVALVTIANVGDNVSVYVPLFRHLDPPGPRWQWACSRCCSRSGARPRWCSAVMRGWCPG